MAWREITEADLLLAISGPELTGFREAALAGGQIDPVHPAILQVTRFIRGKVAACPENKLGLGQTIPDELMGAAADLIILDIMSRAAGTVIDPEGQRAKANDEALVLLREVAACKFRIEQPTDVSDEVVQSGPSVETVNMPPLRATRDKLGGV